MLFLALWGIYGALALWSLTVPRSLLCLPGSFIIQGPVVSTMGQIVSVVCLVEDQRSSEMAHVLWINSRDRGRAEELRPIHKTVSQTNRLGWEVCL